MKRYTNAQQLLIQNEFGVDEVIGLMGEKPTTTALNKKNNDKVTAMPSAHDNKATAQKPEVIKPVNQATNVDASSAKLAFECNDLAQLKQVMLDFEGCALKKLANNMVFGDGNPDADIMFIGEAPGEEEDRQGIPFIGKSGKLLDNIMASIGLHREKNVYISNVVAWRPPGNRTPTPQETKICLPFLLRHIELVQPKVIVLVGATAMTGLLPEIKMISQARLKTHELNISLLKQQYNANVVASDTSQVINTIVTYHPSYLLRSPRQKIHAWHDMLLLKKLINI